MSYEDDFNHLKIQLEDIMKATNNFGDKLIGSGGFGKVYKGELNLREGRRLVAFKRLDRRFGQGDIEFWKEILMLSKLRHENLVSLLHFCNEGAERILVYEYASHGSLDSHLGDPDLTWTRRLQICTGVARGLKYLHDPRKTHDRVLHRDIKSSNVLLDEKWNAKLSDFGLSKIGPANQSRTYLISNVVGTHGYCDPWYYKTNELTKESDVYSFGVVLFEVMCGRTCHKVHNGKLVSILVDAWQKCYDEGRLSEVLYDDSKEKIDEESLKTFSTIANRCLNYKRAERPTMVELIEELDIALQQQPQQSNHQEARVGGGENPNLLPPPRLPPQPGSGENPNLPPPPPPPPQPGGGENRNLPPPPQNLMEEVEKVLGGEGSITPGSMVNGARMLEMGFHCPRCDSTNTKFCYFNNYNLCQPRHYCKTCRRYWTRGGALRNVPVGGGCRSQSKLMPYGLS